MKSFLVKSLRLTLVCTILCSAAYPLFVLAIARFSPTEGLAHREQIHGRTVGYTQLAQRFSGDSYFWSRPSACGYNAAASAATNKGPSNPDYLAQLILRRDSVCAHSGVHNATQVPSDLVTASGSGLDPHCSPAAVYLQISRVARARGISESAMRTIVDTKIQGPWLGMFGPAVVNVLQLNIILDSMNTAPKN